MRRAFQEASQRLYPARLLRVTHRRVTRSPVWLRRILGTVVIGWGGIIAGLALLWYAFPFPQDKLESWPASPEIQAQDGTTLLRQVGSDDQWRIPIPLQDMGPWIAAATVAVEDERFYEHPGVDGVAVLRASMQNLEAGRTVSGASTLTMQVCRMLEPRARTMKAKSYEAFRALQLEAQLTKLEILEHYLNVAPYGGNLRGVEAAARRYFGKPTRDLTLAEAALLAGLPQSPTRLRPDRNPEAALGRRATVLRRMLEEGVITAEQHAAAAGEELRLRMSYLQETSDHFAWLAWNRRPRGGRTTLDPKIQTVVRAVAEGHRHRWPQRADVAIAVIDIGRSELIALVGSAHYQDPVDGQVNGATAWRSPGSTLKPFIYAAAFAAARLTPECAIPDRPASFAGWSPRNFSDSYRGEVEVAEALRQSLNLPAIHVAQAVGLERIRSQLHAVGVNLPSDVVAKSGLALVTGGAEARLLDLVNGYATLGRGGIYRRVKLFVDAPPTLGESLGAKRRALPEIACQHIDAILSCRHQAEFAHPDRAAWFMEKTGTSSGFRDAWTLGHNGRFAIGVWVGYFSGAGDRALQGAHAAAPVLRELFQHQALRTTEEPDPPGELLVQRPLRFETETTKPRILSPRDGSEFVTRAGTVWLPLEVRNPSAGTWFLNGSALDPGAEQIELGVGRHEVRYVSTDGTASASRFRVR